MFVYADWRPEKLFVLIKRREKKNVPPRVESKSIDDKRLVVRSNNILARSKMNKLLGNLDLETSMLKSRPANKLKRNRRHSRVLPRDMVDGRSDRTVGRSNENKRTRSPRLAYPSFERR